LSYYKHLVIVLIELIRSFSSVHHGYPLQPVIQDSLPYLGNDLLSWCWDIDNKCLLHACKTMSRYPVDEGSNALQFVGGGMFLVMFSWLLVFNNVWRWHGQFSINWNAYGQGYVMIILLSFYHVTLFMYAVCLIL